MLKFLEILFVILLTVKANFARFCFDSSTTVTGTAVKTKKICSGDLIFEDNFNNLNTSVWLLENSMGIGGGSKEFQWYINDPQNAYTDHGILQLKPTLTADIYGDEFLYSGNVYIPPDKCTQNIFDGCNKTGNNSHIINPVRSIRMNTMKSFAFKYGTLEIRAKLPAGDWLFPALWLNPRFSVYGGWPVSGEIDLMESRGNRNLFSGSTHVGVEQVSSTLHFGPKPGIDAWRTAHYVKNTEINGYDQDFHIYKLIWTEKYFEFFVDDKLIGLIEANEGFFKRGGYQNSNFTNPWSNATLMAPFDQEFYVIIDLAVGGINFFSDSYVNVPVIKPWRNNSTRPAADFWEAREQWLPGWNLNKTDDSNLQIDYVRIYAL